MDKTQELFLGQKINVQTMPGREGKAIGRLSDGRVILFDQASPHYDVLAPGQSVEGHVIVISENYVIVSPIREPERVDDKPILIVSPVREPEIVEAEPVPEVYMDDIIEELEKLAGKDFDETIGDLENLIRRVPKNAKTIPRALIHIIRLERLIIKILTRENKFSRTS